MEGQKEDGEHGSSSSSYVDGADDDIFACGQRPLPAAQQLKVRNITVAMLDNGPSAHGSNSELRLSSFTSHS